MMQFLILIGLLTVQTAHAQVPLYDSIKELVELENQSNAAELAIQRFALGVYYDQEQVTVSEEGESVPFDMEEETYVDLSLQQNIAQMCGTQEGKKNDLATCTQVQQILREIVDRNAWLRTLGRDLQAITSGYEAGVDGYPGKSIDVIAKFAGINHIWRAVSDPYVTPILEKLTRARPWPDDQRDDIKDKAGEIAELINGLEKEWEEKKDRTELTAAVWRYRHGVQYVQDEEGEDCEDANNELDEYLECIQGGDDPESCLDDFEGEYTPDPSMIMLQRRWCDIEEKAIELRDLLQEDDVDVSQDEDVIYPSHVDQENNFTIWMRHDDVGLQWYLPLEPVQATLYHPDYDDCIEGGDIRSCYNEFNNLIIRGGKYPSKIGETESLQQPLLLGGGAVPDFPDGADEDDIRKNNMVVQEPDEGKGICSHPFSKRGYLCRTIEAETCDVSADQQDQLVDAGTGGIILTRCEPERFNGDVAKRTSGSDICDIGGWLEAVDDPEEQSIIPKDTPEKQDDMVPPPCVRCVVDVECKDECKDGVTDTGITAKEQENGVINVCVPNNPPGKGQVYYLMMHEITHAQQMCGQSNMETLQRLGNTGDKAADAESCCALEREAYFVQCKLMALDGILEQAGITIDQCASTYANFSCASYDEDPSDDEYICSSDNIDPVKLQARIDETRDEMAEDLKLPETCEEALNHPRVIAARNSMPVSCEPGCELQYANTIGNNLCYIGQCIEQTHEVARDIPGRAGLTTLSQAFPWDACEKEDPKLGAFEVPPAITGPKFPLYRPRMLLNELDRELCQINGLPAKTPPVLCGFDPTKRLGLPPLLLAEAADDLTLQSREYDATGLSIQYAASAIASRVTADMFTQYMKPASQNFADLLNTMYDVLNSIGELEFPSTMCPRYTDENFTCDQLQ